MKSVPVWLSGYYCLTLLGSLDTTSVALVPGQPTPGSVNVANTRLHMFGSNVQPTDYGDDDDGSRYYNDDTTAPSPYLVEEPERRDPHLLQGHAQQPQQRRRRRHRVLLPSDQCVFASQSTQYFARTVHRQLHPQKDDYVQDVALSFPGLPRLSDVVTHRDAAIQQSHHQQRRQQQQHDNGVEEEPCYDDDDEEEVVETLPTVWDDENDVGVDEPPPRALAPRYLRPDDGAKTSVPRPATSGSTHTTTTTTAVPGQKYTIPDNALLLPERLRYADGARTSVVRQSTDHDDDDDAPPTSRRRRFKKFDPSTQRQPQQQQARHDAPRQRRRIQQARPQQPQQQQQSNNYSLPPFHPKAGVAAAANGTPWVNGNSVPTQKMTGQQQQQVPPPPGTTPPSHASTGQRVVPQVNGHSHDDETRPQTATFRQQQQQQQVPPWGVVGQPKATAPASFSPPDFHNNHGSAGGLSQKPPPQFGQKNGVPPTPPETSFSQRTVNNDSNKPKSSLPPLGTPIGQNSAVPPKPNAPFSSMPTNNHHNGMSQQPQRKAAVHANHVPGVGTDTETNVNGGNQPAISDELATPAVPKGIPQTRTTASSSSTPREQQPQPWAAPQQQQQSPPLGANAAEKTATDQSTRNVAAASPFPRPASPQQERQPWEIPRAQQRQVPVSGANGVVEQTAMDGPTRKSPFSPPQQQQQQQPWAPPRPQQQQQSKLGGDNPFENKKDQPVRKTPFPPPQQQQQQQQQQPWAPPFPTQQQQQPNFGHANRLEKKTDQSAGKTPFPPPPSQKRQQQPWAPPASTQKQQQAFTPDRATWNAPFPPPPRPQQQPQPQTWAPPFPPQSKQQRPQQMPAFGNSALQEKLETEEPNADEPMGLFDDDSKAEDAMVDNDTTSPSKTMDPLSERIQAGSGWHAPPTAATKSDFRPAQMSADIAMGPVLDTYWGSDPNNEAYAVEVPSPPPTSASADARARQKAYFAQRIAQSREQASNHHKRITPPASDSTVPATSGNYFAQRIAESRQRASQWAANKSDSNHINNKADHQ